MALCGASQAFYATECLNILSPTQILTDGFTTGKCFPCTRFEKRFFRVRCFSSPKPITPTGSEDKSRTSSPKPDPGSVTRFKFTDFQIFDTVSCGLGGRADERVFEAIITDSKSPMYGRRVVLRQLTTSQAQRRGKRSIEVLKKLTRRMLMYHSYSLQVHGYMYSTVGDACESLTLVHGYHGSFSLRHWLHQSDWITSLESTLILNDKSVKRVGEDKAGGPTVTRQLRIVRMLMRDLLIGVNYLHSHGLAHTELRLENVHLSPIDRHIKVGILGNASDFCDGDRRQMMIAYDMKCVGFIMAKMALRELMNPQIFAKFKAFLVKSNDPSCLREFLLPLLLENNPSGNVGLQILDRNWGAGWNLLSLLLANKPSTGIKCLDALRHPFLCGPRWRISPSIEMVRWGLGSTLVRITEEYIYTHTQRNKLAHIIELMELLNPNSKLKNWAQHLPGRWRFLYSTGRHVGVTFRQPRVRALIRDAHLTISGTPSSKTRVSLRSHVSFRFMKGREWPADKVGAAGSMDSAASGVIRLGTRQYVDGHERRRLGRLAGRKMLPYEEVPDSVGVMKVEVGEADVAMELEGPHNQYVDVASDVLGEVRLQIPPEMFDLSKLVCGTYVDHRLLVVRAVSGSALVFARSSHARHFV